MPIKLGELLVKENLITPQQLQESLQYQKGSVPIPVEIRMA